MDFEILLWIRDHLHNPVTEVVFPVISFLGNAGLIWLLTAAVLLCFRRSRRAGVLVIVAREAADRFSQKTRPWLRRGCA